MAPRKPLKYRYFLISSFTIFARRFKEIQISVRNTKNNTKQKRLTLVNKSALFFVISSPVASVCPRYLDCQIIDYAGLSYQSLSLLIVHVYRVANKCVSISGLSQFYDRFYTGRVNKSQMFCCCFIISGENRQKIHYFR